MAEHGVVAKQLVDKQTGHHYFRAAVHRLHAVDKSVHTEIVAGGFDTHHIRNLHFGNLDIAYGGAVYSHLLFFCFRFVLQYLHFHFLYAVALHCHHTEAAASVFYKFVFLWEIVLYVEQQSGDGLGVFVYVANSSSSSPVMR